MTTIEYFYAAHSAFAYIGSARLMEIARAAKRRIVHRPIDLNRVIAATGLAPFAGMSPTRRAYFFGREIERWAELREVAIMNRRPTHHDKDLALPNGMLIAADIRGFDIDRLAHSLLEAHWRDDADLSDPATLARLGKDAGIDPGPLLDAAPSPEIQAIHEENTDEAIRRSVFGSPTYFVDGDMFYGQDRLEMVERAVERPFPESWKRA
ncbi:MAG: 2-hydroxychromene-2-carboxylate isomerase [Alphaproteobacteria bacterium]|nr:2-hydroxychromene-2-carboxylate isomerase [Alphaproteobacteria bacterium]